MTNLPAVPAEAFLDGDHLAVPADSWTITRQVARTLRTSAGLATREQRLRPLAGRPEPVCQRRFSLAWRHLGSSRDTVEELLAVPGEHRLVLWRPEILAWRADGVATEWTLPGRWLLSTDTVTPPAGLSPDRFHPAVKVTRTGTPLTYVSKTAVDYAAGSPAAGEVWFLEDGSSFKLAAAPTAGEYVFASIVPAYPVWYQEAGAKALTHPLREPLDLVLVEAGETA